MSSDLGIKEARATVARQAPFCLDPSHVHLLLADDQETDRELVALCLEQLQWPARVLSASDGDEAWDLLFDLKPPTMVLSDLEMPVLDGLELLQRIRGDQRTRLTPTFILSDHPRSGRVRQCMEAGANGFFPKPHGLQQMQTLVKTLHAFAFQHCFTAD